MNYQISYRNSSARTFAFFSESDPQFLLPLLLEGVLSLNGLMVCGVPRPMPSPRYHRECQWDSWDRWPLFRPGG